VGDRAAERPRLGPLRVDVDPLVVVGGVGEGVHPLLGDLQPAALAQVLPGQGPDAGQPVDGDAHGCPLSRNALLRTFPEPVRGSASVNTTDFGILYRAICPSRKASSSAGS